MKKIVGLLAVLGVLSTGAAAQVYVGGSYGLGQTTVNCEGQLLRCADYNAGYRLVGGFRLSDGSAIEVGRTSFGTKQWAVVAADSYGLYMIDGKYDVTATTLAVVGHFDINPSAAVLVKLGVAKVKAKLTSYYESEPFDSISESKNSLYWGVGLEHALGAQWKTTVTAEFTKGRLLDETADVKLFSWGLQYQF